MKKSLKKLIKVRSFPDHPKTDAWYAERRAALQGQKVKLLSKESK